MFNVNSKCGRAWAAVLLFIGLSGASVQAEVVYWPLNGLELAMQQAATIGCAHRLSQIGQAAEVWANDIAGQPPPSLQVLTNELGWPSALFCPANTFRAVPTNWAQVDWNQIDYHYIALSNWDNPADVICACPIHTSVLHADGSVQTGDYRLGWPRVTAAPLPASSTPGEDVRLEVRITTNAVQPVSYQWRKEALDYATTWVWINNPDDARDGHWQTNVVPRFIPTDLPGQTNPVLILKAVATNDSGFYSVAATNSVGVAACHPVRLTVDPSFTGMGTNPAIAQAVCANNLRMFAIMANMWELQHAGQVPPAFGALTNADNSLMFGWPLALLCPADTNRIAPPDWPAVDLSNTSYELLSPDPQDQTAVLCRCKVHSYYVEVDGGVILSPQFHGITAAANHTVEASFRVFAGRTNRLEASEDLTHWTPLTTYAPTNGDFTYSESNSLPRRFYRLSLP
jgi:hypothetical protein